MTVLFIKKEVQERLEALHLSFPEQIAWILKEINVLSREELMEIAFMAGQGGAGFSPMTQLQLKIRHNPLTFGPELVGLFRSPEGEIYERDIQWPMFKKKAKEWKPQENGWTYKYDWQPYLSIDPMMDEWDRLEDEHGPNHPDIARIVRKLLNRCLKEYDLDSTKPDRSAALQRGKGAKRKGNAKRAGFLRGWPRLRPRYLSSDGRDGAR